MIPHNDIGDEELKKKIKSGLLTFGGNARLRIYGTLSCKSGKRMKRENRVFFVNEAEAINNGFRPCGSCMKDKYRKWTYSNN